MKNLYASLIAIIALVVFAPVWALGGGVPWGEPINTPDRFIVLGSFNNEAVLDKETGLVWEQSPDTTPGDWFMAQSRCNNRNVGNRKGWRLATIQELASLIDPSVGPPGPTLPDGHPFSNVQAGDYWSATTFASDTSFAWNVDLGEASLESNTKSSNRRVWCVRGGQGVDPQ